ncbi:MAG TPA: DUF4185 domain-containing protein [Limnochordia bacterium]
MGIGPPYPPSPVIRAVEWAPPEQILRLARGKGGDGSDNWPLAWAEDDALYTAYGDGYGFDPPLEEKLGLGFGKILGTPPHLQAINIRSNGENRGMGPRGIKASGLLAIGGTLYMWLRNAGNSQLAVSRDAARTWTMCDWRFTESFGCPTFLHFGKGYAGARDEYVYVYSHDADSAYEPADRMVLARVPSDKLLDRSAYAFFQALDADGNPIWTRSVTQRGAVFTHPGKCYRSGITYNPGLRRYLWCHTVLTGSDARFRGGLAIYDAPEPWGPWTTVFYTEEWDVGPGETSSLPTKWMSRDGRTCHLVFSGNDNFSIRAVRFIT